MACFLCLQHGCPTRERGAARHNVAQPSYPSSACLFPFSAVDDPSFLLPLSLSCLWRSCFHGFEGKNQAGEKRFCLVQLELGLYDTCKLRCSSYACFFEAHGRHSKGICCEEDARQLFPPVLEDGIQISSPCSSSASHGPAGECLPGSALRVEVQSENHFCWSHAPWQDLAWLSTEERNNPCQHLHDGHESFLFQGPARKNHSEVYMFMNFEGPKEEG